MLRFHDLGHFLIGWIAEGRALDFLFQKSHVPVDLFLDFFLPPVADEVAHVFAHRIKGVRLRVRPGEFRQFRVQRMFMVTAFMFLK